MTTSQPLVANDKRDRITRIAQEMMDLSQKIYNVYGAIPEDKVTKLEEARKLLRDIVGAMRW